jgi:hypothetical protein
MVKITITKDGLKIGDTLITKFEVDILKTLLGNYRLLDEEEHNPETKHSSRKVLIWDELGLYAYTDDLHSFYSFTIQFGKDPAFIPKWNIDKWRPWNNFSGELYINGKPYRKYLEKKIERKFIEVKAGNYKCDFERYENENNFSKISVDYIPPKISSNKYVQKKITGEALRFKNFNFKLAIIEELMYTKEILKPKFDVHGFVENYEKREIDIDSEGYEIIPEVKKYFQNLEVSVEVASEVETLDGDGGNEIYLQLCPFWDGEDDLFTIEKIDEDELKQFTNLRRINNALLDNNDKINKLLKKYNVEII